MSKHAVSFMGVPTLQKDNVRLELLASSHAPGLFKYGNEASVFRYMPCSAFNNQQEVKTFIDKALDEYRAGQRIPFAIVDVNSGEALASTSFLALREQHKSVEIGWTWLGVTSQRTGINTRCKCLLLAHAFEDKQCIRVEFKTDTHNSVSQLAIQRIGARKEGVFRSHVICPDSYIRDSVYFSITSKEWPQIKLQLEKELR